LELMPRKHLESFSILFQGEAPALEKNPGLLG